MFWLRNKKFIFFITHSFFIGLRWLHQKPADLDPHCFQKSVLNVEKVMHTVSGLIINVEMVFLYFQGHLGIIIAYLLPQCKVSLELS